MQTEQDARLADLDRLLHALRMPPGPRPYSPAQVFEECLERITALLNMAIPSPEERAMLERIRAGTYVVVCVKHLREAMRFYPPFDHDTKTRLIGDQLRSQIVAAQEETQS